MVRFTQQIFEEDSGEENVTWRGKISHVQGGDEINFSEVEQAIGFIQGKLKDLTLDTTSHKSKEEQEGLLGKSFDIWKKMAKNAPQMVMETIKDPKGQVANIREQLTDVGEEIGQKLEIDTWRTASKSDLKDLIGQISSLNKKVDAIADKLDKMS